MHRILSLPSSTHCDLQYAIADCAPILDKLCHRICNFLFSFLHIGLFLIRFVVLHGLCYVGLRQLAFSLWWLAMQLFFVRRICTRSWIPLPCTSQLLVNLKPDSPHDCRAICEFVLKVCRKIVNSDGILFLPGNCVIHAYVQSLIDNPVAVAEIEFFCSNF